MQRSDHAHALPARETQEILDAQTRSMLRTRKPQFPLLARRLRARDFCANLTSRVRVTRALARNSCATTPLLFCKNLSLSFSHSIIVHKSCKTCVYFLNYGTSGKFWLMMRRMKQKLNCLLFHWNTHTMTRECVKEFLELHAA